MKEISGYELEVTCCLFGNNDNLKRNLPSNVCLWCSKKRKTFCFSESVFISLVGFPERDGNISSRKLFYYRLRLGHRPCCICMSKVCLALVQFRSVIGTNCDEFL